MIEQSVAELTLIVASSVLIHAGLAKLMAPDPTIEAATRLGVPTAVAPYAVSILAVAEIVLALGIGFSRHLLVAASVAGIGTMFAAAGVRGIVKGESIPCACFGHASAERILGWRQVAFLPAWLGVAAILRTETATSAGLDLRLVAVAGALLVVHVRVGIPLLGSVSHRRQATAPMQ